MLLFPVQLPCVPHCWQYKESKAGKSELFIKAILRVKDSHKYPFYCHMQEVRRAVQTECELQNRKGEFI